jgi:RNA polymerase sigma-70 factor (ECF subfamily)
MRAAIAGDAAAYERFLRLLTPVLRSLARRNLAHAGQEIVEAEDVVQETLLAIHLKRHTWDADKPVAPWVLAIARNKLIDALRRSGRHRGVAIDDFAETLAAQESEPSPARDIERQLERLSERQGAVVRAVSVDGLSIREAAIRLGISEGAVRVALHRGLANLAARLRDWKP